VTERSNWGRLVVVIYAVSVLVFALAAARRLTDSIDMPGLQAWELLLLALPWSLLLGVDPVSRAPLLVSLVVVLLGVVINGALLYSLGRVVEKAWRKRSPRAPIA
jgi:hypothetical protein